MNNKRYRFSDSFMEFSLNKRNTAIIIYLLQFVNAVGQGDVDTGVDRGTYPVSNRGACRCTI